MVRIGSDLTGLNKGLNQAEKDVQRVGRKLSRLGGELTQNLTLPILAVGAALAASAVHVGTFADELLDLVDMTGLSSDALQEFRHVATIAGVETDTLAQAAIKLTTKLSSGGEQTKELAGALGRLGLKATDAGGNLVSMDTLLPAIIGKLQGMTDITTRNAIAADIFGKSWAELAPILSLGAGSMEKARKAAHDLGLVMSKEDVEAANAFRAKLDTLKSSLAAVTREVGMSMLPVMERLVKVLQDDIVPTIKAMIDGFNNLSPVTKTAIGVIAALVAGLGPLLLILGKVLTLLPLIRLAFTALLGPLGLVLTAVGLLASAWVAWEFKQGQAMRTATKALDDYTASLRTLNREQLMTLAADIIKKQTDWEKLPQTEFVQEKIAALEKQLIAVTKMFNALPPVVAKITNALSQLTGEYMSQLMQAVDLNIATSKEVQALNKLYDEGVQKLNAGNLSLEERIKLTERLRAIDDQRFRRLDPSASVDSGWSSMPGGMFGDGSGLGDLGKDMQNAAQQLASRFGGAFAGALSGVLSGNLISAAVSGVLGLVDGIMNMGEASRAAREAMRQFVAGMDAFIDQMKVDLGLLGGAEAAKNARQRTLDDERRALQEQIRGRTGTLLAAASQGTTDPEEIRRRLEGLAASDPALQALLDRLKELDLHGKDWVDGIDRATDAVNTFADALSNIPRVLNVNALRHMVTGGPALGPMGGPMRSGPMGGSSVIQWTGNIIVPGAGDPGAVANAVGRAIERTLSRGGTSRVILATT